MTNNDLIDFINAASNQMDAEYNRISKRTLEDPGTAGDQGEENWAALLREWLPPIFQIVTKGRLVNSEGQASPQIDVIILKPEYPNGLLNKKLYLIDGVLAAFECKLTLRDKDITSFFKNSAIIKKLSSKNNTYNIYDELQGSMFYGLLAHSHIWKNNNKIFEKISNRIYKYDIQILKHPIEMPDVICIANTGCWTTIKFPLPSFDYTNKDLKEGITTAYVCNQNGSDKEINPIGSMLNWLLFRLSKEHRGLWSISRYFIRTLSSTGSGPAHFWLIDQVFSERALKELRILQKDKHYRFPDDWKFLGTPPP